MNFTSTYKHLKFAFFLCSESLFMLSGRKNQSGKALFSRGMHANAYTPMAVFTHSDMMINSFIKCIERVIEVQNALTTQQHGTAQDKLNKFQSNCFCKVSHFYTNIKNERNQITIWRLSCAHLNERSIVQIAWKLYSNCIKLNLEVRPSCSVRCNFNQPQMILQST